MAAQQQRRIAYGHRQHEQGRGKPSGHYLHSKVRSDVWGCCSSYGSSTASRSAAPPIT